MKIAVITDIHGNFEALEGVLAEVRLAGADRIICLGDVVGYGPQPRECIELLLNEASVILLGNHDAAAVDLAAAADFNENARAAVEWTNSVLSDGDRDFLASLPYVHREENCFFVHASPYQPAQWNYVAGRMDAERSFSHFSEKVCFIGHTHRPFIASMDSAGALEVVEEWPVELKDDCRYLVNAGSVGQPRDFDPRAAWVMLDTALRTVSVQRVLYDVEKTRELMASHGLPRFLIDRLQSGR